MENHETHIHHEIRSNIKKYNKNERVLMNVWKVVAFNENIIYVGEMTDTMIMLLKIFKLFIFRNKR